MAEQLGLDLPSVPALGRADFLVAPSNAQAFALIDGWQHWPGGKLLLCGPAGAGKTHLAHVFAAATGARIVPALGFDPEDIPGLAHGPVVVEDFPRAAGHREAETALFHLHNLCLAEGQPLLLTGRGRPADWPLDIPDLASRIVATPATHLAAPDDTLLAAVLAKLFADRQFTPAPDLIAYLLCRMDRSFEGARDLVSRLDAASLAEKRPITRALAARVLDNPRQPKR